MKRYVWLDLNTGKFSNSWDDEMHKHMDDVTMKSANERNWKLIEYTCLNDASFELYDLMKIVTNTTLTTTKK